MSAAAYYNEIDPFAAQWLRNLIAAGHIAPGEVDERSIEDVTPDDLRGFTQCHFFAGIGVWSHSSASPDGPTINQSGLAPARASLSARQAKEMGLLTSGILWPHFFHLISERRPQHVFGEQVAAGNANAWFDLVQADLEGSGIRLRACAAYAQRASVRRTSESGPTGWPTPTASSVTGTGTSGRMGGMNIQTAVTLTGWPTPTTGVSDEGETLRSGRDAVLDGSSTNRLGNANLAGLERYIRDDSPAGWQERLDQLPRQAYTAGPLEVNGFWRDADWLLCRDGKWRPVEPGTFPLVDGAAARMGRVESGVAKVASGNRVGRLKGYGNAINAQAAAAFIRAYMGVA